MKATLAPLKFRMEYGAKSVSPVDSCTTFAARKSKSAPAKGVPSWHPSVG